LDKLREKIPFPVRVIQLDGCSELYIEFERSLQWEEHRSSLCSSYSSPKLDKIA